MARALNLNTRSGGGQKLAKAGRSTSKSAHGVQAAVKSVTVGRRSAAKTPAAASAVSKDDLRARIEKLERANATLRAKNKDLRLANVEAAEQLDELTVRLEAAERRAGRQVRGETETVSARGRGAAPPSRRRASARDADSHLDEDGSDDMAPSRESMTA